MKYLAKHQILCFSLSEMRGLFKKAKLDQLYEEIGAGNIDLMDLFNPEKLAEIASVMSGTIGKRKEEVEIFSAIYLFHEYYGDDINVCFYLKDSFNPKRDQINNMNDLIGFTKENSQTDFLFQDAKGFRQIQLKTYKGVLNTQALADYIAKTLNRYGREMGSVNLLFLLQSKDGDLANMDLKELHKKVLEMELTFKGEILLSFNLQNEFNVICRVYPEYGLNKVPIERRV